MKFQKTLMVLLIASEMLLNEAYSSDIKNSDQILQLNILTNSVKIELPMPVTTERQKFIINVTSDNGFICHNFLREKELKDKLFSLQTKVAQIPEIEKKYLEEKTPVSFINSNTWRDIFIGMGIGIISGFVISKKIN